MEQTPPANTSTNTPKKPKQDVTFAFDPKRYIGSLIGYWYWIVACILLSFLFGLIYIATTKPMYAIKSSLLVNEEDNASSDILDKLNIVKKIPVNFFNEMNTLHSEELVRQTVDSLHLNFNYYLSGKMQESELYGECPIKIVFDSAGFKGEHAAFTVKYVTDGHFEVKEGDKSNDVMYDSWITRPWGRYKIQYTYNPTSPTRNYLINEVGVKIENPDYTVRRLMSDFKATSADGRTSVVDLSFNDNLPQRGIEFLLTLEAIYFKNKLSNIDLSAQKTRDFINQHKADLMQNLHNVDSSVETIKLRNDMVDVQSQASNFMSQKNETQKNIDRLLQKRRALFNLRYILLNSRYQIIVALDIEDNVLLDLIKQYNSLVQKLETQEKVQELGTSNPFLIQTIVELEALKRRILDVLSKLTSTVDSDIQESSKTEAAYSARIRNVPSIDRSITDVKRGYDVLQNMYLFLYQKGIENEISVYNEANKAKVLIPPYSSSVPISPIKKTVYTFAILFGLLIPALIFLLLELIGKKIVNEDDITAITDIPIIGIISKAPQSLNLRKNNIAINPGVRTGIAEQFRMLRANMEFIEFIDNKKVITVTSSDSGEGKTFIALNLGIILALGTKRVIVVEFDLRKPKLSDLLNINNSHGISDYLGGHSEMRDVVKPSGIHSNLYIANCGQVPANPGDLLAYPATKQFIEELQEMFDVIIIDTAPVGLVSDALLISKNSGLNLYVIRQAVTDKTSVSQFDEIHRQGKIQNPAIIFNSVEYLKKYGYYSDPHKVYEEQLSDYNAQQPSQKPKWNILSFFKK
ncbi:MAG: polysaccharide biosynthesis tyrosine autokinase [Bacteroidota bacterium]